MKDIWSIERGEGPLVAAAVHDGPAMRDEVRKLMALTDGQRFREEDPFTAPWCQVAPTRIIGLHSRFEVDLNRDREAAVYIKPEDAWGLNVWKEEPAPELIKRSLDEYDAFYRAVSELLNDLTQKYGHVVIFDLHTYNHRRNGPDAPPADPELNPEVNIGTGTMDREYWAPVIDRFMNDLRAFDFLGRKLDVRENIKFKGGGFGRWVHKNYPRKCCALAIEFKKFFMDECTGEPFAEQCAEILKALQSTVPGVLGALQEYSND